MSDNIIYVNCAEMNKSARKNALSGQQGEAPGFVGRAGVSMRTPSPRHSHLAALRFRLKGFDFELVGDHSGDIVGYASQALNLPAGATITPGAVDLPTERNGSPVGRLQEELC